MTIDDIKNTLRKCLRCLYLATERTIADDIQNHVEAYIRAIEAPTKANALTAIGNYLLDRGWVYTTNLNENLFHYVDPITGQAHRTDFAFFVQTEREMYERANPAVSPVRITQMRRVALEDSAYTWSGHDVLGLISQIGALRNFVEKAAHRKGGILLPDHCIAQNLLDEIDGITHDDKKEQRSPGGLIIPQKTDS